MSDAIISIVVQKIGDFLGEFAMQKISEYIGGSGIWERIRKDVEWVQEELKYVQSFIEYAEGSPSIEDTRVQNWTVDMGDVAWDIRDLLETYALEIKGKDAQQRGFVHYINPMAKNGFVEMQELEKKIKLIKEKLEELIRRRKSYGIRNLGARGQGSSIALNNELTRQLRRTMSYRHEDHLAIDLEDQTKILLDQLHKPELQRVVIAIHGMGGLGKTTIAQKLYNSVVVSNKFDCQAWVCVSQDYNIENLLRIIIKSLCRLPVKDFKMIQRMTEDDMERYLRSFLRNRKYLLVLDDVWDKLVWKILKRAFPESKNVSRVIITTRNESVATSADDKTFLHNLRFLTEIESWKLFCAIVFQGDGEAHLDFSAKKELGKEMVGKCRGLPLAIIVLGGLLFHKESLQEWLMVKEQLWQQLRDDSIEISHLLSLSYNDLPRHVKPCFLYVGMFPEDHEFEARKLMQSWMAEDFAQEGNTMEDEAEGYLKELISRSLIQVTQWACGDIVFKCKVHDLLRNLAVEKAQGEKFFDIYDPHKYSATSSSNSRRLAVHSHVDNFFELNHTNSKLWSLVLFNKDGAHWTNTHLDFIAKYFKSLRVLSLEKFPRQSNLRLPDTIGELIYLKLLWLPEIFEVPHAIGNIKCLKFLNFGMSKITIIRGGIGELKLLRHLYGKFEGNLRLVSSTNLRTLGRVSSKMWCEIDTTKLVHLRRLRVRLMEPDEHVIHCLQSVTKLERLEDLYLCRTDLDNLEIPIQILSSCRKLLKLRISGTIKNRKLPPINEFPPYLEMLYLCETGLMEDPFPVLKGLANLKYLYLCEYAYLGKKIVCTAGGFHQLKTLDLEYLKNLEEWQVEKGAMPMLKMLNMYECDNLAFPEELKHVSVTANRCFISH